jgi:hypothetical protein
VTCDACDESAKWLASEGKKLSSSSRHKALTTRHCLYDCGGWWRVASAERPARPDAN